MLSDKDIRKRLSLPNDAKYYTLGVEKMMLFVNNLRGGLVDPRWFPKARSTAGTETRDKKREERGLIPSTKLELHQYCQLSHQQLLLGSEKLWNSSTSHNDL